MLLDIANAVSSSLIRFNLMTGGDTFFQYVGSHKSTWRHITEEGILHSHRQTSNLTPFATVFLLYFCILSHAV
jgi:hypothetical protein